MKLIYLLSIDMAPELLTEEPYNCKVDIYSFAIILYEMLYGPNPMKTLSTNHLLFSLLFLSCSCFIHSFILIFTSHKILDADN